MELDETPNQRIFILFVMDDDLERCERFDKRSLALDESVDDPGGGSEHG
ncbi:hypothetical protein [Cryobacterium zongtaii]|nr:hypothetical protein [Cryobacterium zongtaii]